jgi:hypothetical protein
MKYLELYKDWRIGGKIPKEGLCASLNFPKRLEMFEPTREDAEKLQKKNMSTAYWGSGMTIYSNDKLRYYSFTPLRQTILLFLAAINNEL